MRIIKMQVGHASHCVEGLMLLKLNWAEAGSEPGIEFNLLLDDVQMNALRRKL